MFGTDIAGEYALAAAVLGVAPAELAALGADGLGGLLVPAAAAGRAPRRGRRGPGPGAPARLTDLAPRAAPAVRSSAGRVPAECRWSGSTF